MMLVSMGRMRIQPAHLACTKRKKRSAGMIEGSHKRAMRYTEKQHEEKASKQNKKNGSRSVATLHGDTK